MINYVRSGRMRLMVEGAQTLKPQKARFDIKRGSCNIQMRQVSKDMRNEQRIPDDRFIMQYGDLVFEKHPGK